MQVLAFSFSRAPDPDLDVAEPPNGLRPFVEIPGPPRSAGGGWTTPKGQCSNLSVGLSGQHRLSTGVFFRRISGKPAWGDQKPPLGSQRRFLGIRPRSREAVYGTDGNPRPNAPSGAAVDVAELTQALQREAEGKFK